MRRFGIDKPGLRFGLEHTDITGVVIEQLGGGVPFFAETAERFANGTLRCDVPAEIVKVMRVPTDAKPSRKDIDEPEKMAISIGANGLARAKVGPDGSWTQTAFKTASADESLRDVIPFQKT